MKKIIIIFIFLIFIYGCNTEKTLISFNKNNISCYSNIKLYDLIKIKNGKILTKNYKINTDEIGSKSIKFKYKDNKKNIKNTTFTIKIIDNVKPIIMSSNTYYLEKGEQFNILDSIVCADNYDRNPVCSIIGSYDVNKTGEYNLKIHNIDSSNNESEKDIKLIVREHDNNSYESSTYKIKDLIKKYKNDNTMIGIDVSFWQGNINYEKVKKSGVEFVMIRIGYGHTSKNEIILDDNFKQNLKSAKEAGLLVGVYFYSYAANKKEAIQEAQWIIDNLNGEKLDLPITLDWEDWNDFNDYDINIHDLNNIALSFLKEIDKSNYDTMLYGSASYLEKIWNLPQYKTWLAHYTDKTTYEKDYYIWQLTNQGEVDGIQGNVDLNVLYKN